MGLHGVQQQDLGEVLLGEITAKMPPPGSGVHDPCGVGGVHVGDGVILVWSRGRGRGRGGRVVVKCVLGGLGYLRASGGVGKEELQPARVRDETGLGEAGRGKGEV